MKPYDLIILGGGRAANLAIAAGKQGKRVALVEKETLQAKGIEYIKVVEPWSASARALAMKVEWARTKLLVSKQGAILGCHLIGPQASTLIHEVLPVLAFKNDVRVLVDTIHIHPALSEVILAAARHAAEILCERHQFCGPAIHR